MKAEDKLRLESIKIKLTAGIKLTREEDLFYLTHAVGLPKKEAVSVLAINENKDKNIIRD